MNSQGFQHFASGLEEQFDSSLLGDFYAPRDDVVRGVYLGAAPSFDIDMKSIDLWCQDDCKQKISQQPLIDVHAAPKASSLALTHFNAPAYCGPCEVLQDLLKFFASLTEGVAVSVIKVNSDKFTIKADAHVDWLPFTFKVRIYQGTSPSDAHIVEFQRRSGDSIAFQRLYQHALHHFSNQQDDSCALMDDSESLETSICLEPPPCAGDSSTSTVPSLEPFLSMAEATNDVRLLEEAAFNLASLCTRSADAVEALMTQMRSPRALAVALKLLEVDSFSTKFPIAWLLTHMSCYPEMQNLLVENGLLSAMLESLRIPDVCKVARPKLSQAINKVLCGCVNTLPDKTIMELDGLLKTALFGHGSEDGVDVAVCGNLIEAREVLHIEANGRRITCH